MGNTINISKQFNCSKEDLFKAWTEEDELKQWWKPLGKELGQMTNELRKGGTVQYIFENGNLTIEGQYEKVEENRLLEYTWNWHLATKQIEDADYKLSVSFEGDETTSTLSVTQFGFNDEKGIEPHRLGWEQALEALENYSQERARVR